MAAAGGSNAGRCTDAGCGCLAFASNLYRPALCIGCYHSIAEHYPGQWSVVFEPETGKVFYQHAHSRARLYARPYDPAAGSGVLKSVAPDERPPDPAGRRLSKATLEPFSGASSSGAAVPRARSASTRLPAVRIASAGDTATPAAPLVPRSRQVMAFRPVPVGSRDTSAVLLPSSTPTAVPQRAIANLTLDLSQLSTQPPLGSVAPPPVNVSPAASLAAVPISSVAIVEPSPSMDMPGSVTGSVTARAEQQHPTPSAESALVTQVGAVDPAIAAFLQPLYEDPLLVYVDAAAFSPGGHNGISAFTMDQPFNEFISVPRVLVLTPFTVMALAPHPTRQSVGVLCWERSLLSLTHLATQTLYSAQRATGVGGMSPDQPTQAPSPSAQGQPSATGGFSSWLRHMTSRGTAASAGPAPRHSVAVQPSAGLVASGVGVLASFAPETEDTVAFLRVWRAGRAPVSRRGFLLKRKQAGGWHDRAPLGPLAWKRRFFVLGTRDLPYYARASAAGEPVELKGTVPLDGWIEVSRTGRDLAASSRAFGADLTSRTRCFLVRTGKTFHVFQAPTADDAGLWIEAITVNAQHVGAHQHAPQCIILPSEADAIRVATIIRNQRQHLLSAMSSAARERLGDASAEMIIDVATPVALRRTVAEEEADLQAAAAFASEEDDEDRDELRGDGPSSGGALTLDDALALAAASGGLTEEFLQQLPRDVARQVLQYHLVEESSAASRSRDQICDVPQRPDIDAGALASSDEWVFVDDSDHPHGPLSASIMRAKISEGGINAATLVRSCSSLPGLGVEQCVDESGIPMLYLPVGVLFPAAAVEDMFGPPSTWVSAYEAAAVFDSLVGSASQLGVDRGVAAHHALYMKDNGLPPDLSILLDLCGVAALHVETSAAAGGNGSAHGTESDSLESLRLLPPLDATQAAAAPAGSGSTTSDTVTAQA